MRFEKALEHLMLGKKIRQSDWQDECYLILKNGVLLDEDNLIAQIETQYILLNNWELYEEKGISKERVNVIDQHINFFHTEIKELKEKIKELDETLHTVIGNINIRHQVENLVESNVENLHQRISESEKIIKYLERETNSAQINVKFIHERVNKLERS